MFFDTVIFDFDYTLADGTDAIVACYNHAFRAFGYPDGEREAVRRTVGMTVRDSIKLLTGCKDTESIEKMRLLFREKADEILAKNTFLFEGTKPLLRRLKEAGVKTAIVSSKERVRIEESLSLGGADGLIDNIVGVSDAPAPKPSPEGVRLAVTRAEAVRALYVGDSLIDYETAKNAGLPFAAVTTGTTTEADFLKLKKEGKVRFFGVFSDLFSLSDALFTEKRLYVTDIDGTLKTHGDAVSDRSASLIAESQSENAFFTAATARGVCSALSALAGVPVNAPLICLSGAEIYDPAADTLTRFPIEAEKAEKVRKRASELGLEAFYYLSEKGKKELFILCENIRSDGGKRFISMRNTVKGQNFVYSEADLPKNQAECLYFVFIGEEAAAEAMEAYVKSQGGLSSERFHERLSGCVYLEVFSAKGGKGKAAERLANTLFAERVIAFGDNHNDLSLREVADEFYVPEGAVREAKEAADGVIKGEDAVARFIACREGKNPADLVFGLASKDDVPALAALEKKAFSEFYSEKLLEKSVSSENEAVFTVKECGIICGYLIASFSPDFCEILKIFVKKPLRNKGLATKLHSMAVAEAKSRGLRKIYLEVRTKNPAVKFYEKLGYKKDGVRKGYYAAPPDDAQLMSFTF